MKTFQQRLDEIEAQRMRLRDELVEQMRTNPNLKDSETLRKVEGDIIFWRQQTDQTLPGLISTLQDSFKQLED